MHKPLKIGITGGIGSGKTLVSGVFQKLGAPTYNADDRAKWLMNNNTKIIIKVIDLFGPEAYINGELNRSLIAKQVFKNTSLLAKLNAVVHPIVFDDFDEWYETQTYPYVLKEAALLFESGSYRDLDAIITVDAPLEIRLKRASIRDQKSEDEIKGRIKNQYPNEIKVKAADFVINNDGITPVLPQLLKLHQLWM
jgi:dephospho-CoA kinase